MKYFIVVALLAVAAFVEAKVFTEQEFKAELAKANVTGSNAEIFTCIADFVSGLSTRHVVEGATSADYGIFQISNAYWCSPPGRLCRTSCRNFLDDDIQDDIKCALKIKSIHGFYGWAAYEAYCK